MTLLCIATNLLAVVIVLAGFVIYVGVYSILKAQFRVQRLDRRSRGGHTATCRILRSHGSLRPGSLDTVVDVQPMADASLLCHRCFSAGRLHCCSHPGLAGQTRSSRCRRHMFGYISAFIAATLMLTLASAGLSTFAVAVGLGLSWLYLAWSGHGASDQRLWARKLFIFSILTICIVSLMISIDFTSPVPSEMLLSYAP